MSFDYGTIRSASSIELTVNKSRFIGQAFPADTEENALILLENTRKRFRDASHNCYAYSIGREGGPARFSDDGEPQGTAGLPIMEALKHMGVTDLLVVVTRYFGGVLLGAGGLVRAYTKAAVMAIEAAEHVIARRCTAFTLVMSYSGYSALSPLLNRYGRIMGTEYTDEVKIEITVLDENVDEFVSAVIERTDGKVRPMSTGTVFMDFPAGKNCAV